MVGCIKEIVKDLTDWGYMSGRGRVLKENHVERMYKKLLEKRKKEGERDIEIGDLRIVYRD